MHPTKAPSHTPTKAPSHTLTKAPSHTLTKAPSHTPTKAPTLSATINTTNITTISVQLNNHADDTFTTEERAQLRTIVANIAQLNDAQVTIANIASYGGDDDFDDDDDWYFTPRYTNIAFRVVDVQDPFQPHQVVNALNSELTDGTFVLQASTSLLYDCDSAYAIGTKDYAQETLALNGDSPVYGTSLDDVRARQYCMTQCAFVRSNCASFFYQRHSNNHEICGYYTTNQLSPNVQKSSTGPYIHSAVCAQRVQPSR